jgi:hypothetical protein
MDEVVEFRKLNDIIGVIFSTPVISEIFDAE